MRTKEQMMDLIMGIAKNDDRVRAVYMNGSRTNPNAPADLLQDYDIVYVVEETASFIADRTWPERFGDILFMQYPDEHPDYPSDKENSYGWLMIFTDGNRLDLTVMTIARAKENVLEDSLCIILLDKDGILPAIPESSDETYRVRKPTEAQFATSCNEFWWCLNNVAKGLWRNEPTYVQDMLGCVVRPQLLKMLSWEVGIMTDWKVSGGKSGKYLSRWLPSEEWERYLSTYCSADITETWDAVMRMCELFTEVSARVAEKLGYDLNRSEIEGCMHYLTAVRALPKDAETLTL